jgi:hypothetical protein
LQNKVNELEDLLRAVSGGESANTAETLRTWRQTGSTNAQASSSRINTAIDAPASDEGNDDTGAGFDTPPSDQYIYDTTGYVTHNDTKLRSGVS